MRFDIQSPSMALNACGAVPYFQMDNNYVVSADHTPVNILKWVQTYAKGQSGNKLNALVIHCHSLGHENGTNALGKSQLTFGVYLDLGTGITRDNTYLFKEIKGYVENIYITACGAAEGKNGELMCKEISGFSGANVYASSEVQSGWSSPFGIVVREWRSKNMVEFDGAVWCYAPDGAVSLLNSDLAKAHKTTG